MVLEGHFRECGCVLKQNKKGIMFFAVAFYTLELLLGFVFLVKEQFTVDQVIDIGLLFTLMALINFFPIKVKEHFVVLANTISLAAFLHFGFWVEVILTQLTMLSTWWRYRLTSWEWLFGQLVLLLVTSFSAAGVFYLLGGRTGVLLSAPFTSMFLPILGYLLIIFLFNYFHPYVLKWFLEDVPLGRRGNIWQEALPVLIFLPIGALLSLLFAQNGRWAFFYVFFPFLALSVILMLFYRLQEIYQKLQVIHKLANGIAAQLDMGLVIDRLMEAVGRLLPYQYCYLLLVDINKQVLKPVRLVGDGILPEEYQRFMQTEVDLQNHVCDQKGQGNEINERYFRGKFSFLRQQKSVYSIPLLYDQQLYGILTVTHKQANQYTKDDLPLVEILAHQGAIALKNAADYERTRRRSERDELTGLYNYRYFERGLEEMIRKSNGPFALILLDIDYFKKVNDHYGHLAGNKILRHIATILKEEVEERGTVARFGGEEFVILLENVTEEEAYRWAEALREKIASTPVFIQSDLAPEDNREHAHYVSVSMGIAMYPFHARDALSLIRQADRAMYMGAKRKGRNKVAVYSNL